MVLRFIKTARESFVEAKKGTEERETAPVSCKTTFSSNKRASAIVTTTTRITIESIG